MTTLANTASATRLPRLVLRDGAAEALKWLALALMVVDHVNKYLLDWSTPWMFAAGRLAMPVFAIVLGYNLARFERSDSAGLRRVLVRLALAAAVASVPFLALGKASAGGWWPLNILVTLASAVAALLLWRSTFPLHRTTAALLFVVGGAVGEFFWPAMAIVLATCSYTRAPSVPTLAVLGTSTALLGLVNGNAWALAALPLVALATQLRLRMPRLRWVFYAAYPAHLAVLWAVLQARPW